MARAFMGSAASLSSFSHGQHSSAARFIPAAASPATSSPLSTAFERKIALSPRRHHPSLEVSGGAYDDFLPAFTTLDRSYEPFPLVAWNAHIETIFAAFFRSVPAVRFKRECLRMKDDGTVAVDWVSGDDRLLPSDTTVLILLPGLTGGSGDGYVRHLLTKARINGYRVVVFNSRSCADSPVTTPQFYSGSFIDDVREVVAHISTRYPKANLYAVGWSLGANILVRYLGQDSHTTSLSGAVSLCNPFNLVMADEDIRKGFNTLYGRSLATALRKTLQKHELLFEEIGGRYNIPLAANAKCIKDFDEGLTSVSFGFKSADDYYQNSGSADVIENVRTPLLCIQAANDPISPNRAIPRDMIQENPMCMLIVTPQGGHLGWVAGAGDPCGAPWTDRVVMDFLVHLERVKAEAEAAASLPRIRKSEENVQQQCSILKSGYSL